MPADTETSFPAPTVRSSPPVSAVDIALMMSLHRQIDQRVENVEYLLSQVARNQTNGAQQVVVKDVSMSFGSMVVFMVKWAIAAIPAAIILFIVTWFMLLTFAGALRAMIFS
jgi:hypothetical protein